MKLWRIATETRSYKAIDLSGTGASVQPGRWNEPGEFVVYSAPTIAMSVIETAAHLTGSGFPQNRFIVEIDVPQAVWSVRTIVDVTMLPTAWDSIPAGQNSVQFGSGWLASMKSPIMVLPSAIVPEESITMINPKHALSSRITAKVIRSYDYSKLLGRLHGD